MSLLDNERIEEWLIILNDNFSTLKKTWVYVLAAVLVLAFPIFLGLKAIFFQLGLNSYTPPIINRPDTNIEPLAVLDKKVFTLNENEYAGFARIKNINLDWGVPELTYTAVLKSLGGTEVTRISGQTFVLPASEKLIVFSKFKSDMKPETIDFSIPEPKFLLKPEIAAVTLEVGRVEINSAQELTVSAVVKNTTPYVIKQISLPVILLDRNNEVIGVNFYSLNDLASLESRSFQYFWPKSIPNVVRAEITPELNIFDRDIFANEAGRNPFDARPE